MLYAYSYYNAYLCSANRTGDGDALLSDQRRALSNVDFLVSGKEWKEWDTKGTKEG